VSPKDAANIKHCPPSEGADDAFRGAINSMQEAFALFDADDRLVFCNEAYTTMHPLGKPFIRPGVSFEDIIRTNVKKGNVSDAIGREEDYLLERMDLHRNPKGPIYRRMANGKTFIINESRTPDGGILFTSTEVTDLKQIEDELRGKEALTRRMLEASPAGVYIATREGEHLFSNERGLEMLGVSRDELFQSNAVSYYADPEERKRLKDDLYETGSTPPTEVEFIKPDGTHFFIILSSTLLDFEGQNAHLTYLYDITERKKTEEALRDSEQRLADAVESIVDGVALYDADDKFVFCNTAFRENLEALDDVLIPGTPFEVVIRAAGERLLYKNDPDGLEQYIPRRLAEHERRESTVHYYPDTDNSVIVQENKTSDGGTFIIRTDITELKRAEGALKSNESRLRGAIDSLQEGFAFYDADDRLVLFNEEYRRLHPGLEDILKPGMYFEDMIRAHIERGLNADAIGREEDHILERMEQHLNPKGKILRTLTNGTCYIIKETRTPDGGTVVTESDITERIKLEKKAQAEHERMLDAMESINGGVALFDANDVLVLCNSTYRENFKEIGQFLTPGHSYEEILHAYVDKGLNTEAKEDPEKYVRERLARHRNLEPSIIQMSKTGHWVMLREYRTSEGGTLIVRTDETERIAAEDALRESEARFRDIADAASDHFWEMGPDLRFTSASDRFYAISGLNPDDIIGKTRLEFVGAETIKENPKLWKAHEEDMKNRRAFGNLEYALKSPDGQVRYFRVSGKPFYDKNGTFMGYRGASADITNYRRAQRDLSHHNKMESLGHLAGGIAHNLNNMLQPILILGQMTKDALDNKSREHQNLEVICQAGASAKELVERISAFSRQQGLIRERADIFKIVHNDLSLIGSTIPPSITVTQDLDENTGFVFVDATQIQTVLMNLVANAVDSMEGQNGELRISLSRTTVDENSAHFIAGLEDGNYAKLTIADTGNGMDQETLSRIFDPFFTTKEFGEGTGLGLSSALGIIQKHGATILAVSEPNIGTTFDVYLPLELSVIN